MDDKLFLKGVCSYHVTYFKFLGPPLNTPGIAKTRDFRLCSLDGTGHMCSVNTEHRHKEIRWCNEEVAEEVREKKIKYGNWNMEKMTWVVGSVW